VAKRRGTQELKPGAKGAGKRDGKKKDESPPAVTWGKGEVAPQLRVLPEGDKKEFEGR